MYGLSFTTGEYGLYFKVNANFVTLGLYKGQNDK